MTVIPDSPGDPFVSAAWLADRLDDVVVADVRWYLDGRPARPVFEAGHLPGAHFVDLDVDLSAPPGAEGRHPLPDPSVFSRAMARIGVHPHSTVVAYDDTGGVTAGRLWWMLDAVGVDARILAGGIDGWPGPLETGEDPPPAGGTVTVDDWPADRFATVDEVAAVADGAASVVLIDARSLGRYRGEANAVDPRFGHVPGARSAPAADNLDSADSGPRHPDDLARHYERLGVGPDTDVIAYCGSGVSACLDLAGLRRAGHRPSRLYVGSWSQWAADTTRPVATGDD